MWKLSKPKTLIGSQVLKITEKEASNWSGADIHNFLSYVATLTNSYNLFSNSGIKSITHTLQRWYLLQSYMLKLKHTEKGFRVIPPAETLRQQSCLKRLGGTWRAWKQTSNTSSHVVARESGRGLLLQPQVIPPSEPSALNTRSRSCTRRLRGTAVLYSPQQIT